jgi:hypothetical protein
VSSFGRWNCFGKLVELDMTVLWIAQEEERYEKGEVGPLPNKLKHLHLILQGGRATEDF